MKSNDENLTSNNGYTDCSPLFSLSTNYYLTTPFYSPLKVELVIESKAEVISIRIKNANHKKYLKLCICLDVEDKKRSCDTHKLVLKQTRNSLLLWRCTVH